MAKLTLRALLAFSSIAPASIVIGCSGHNSKDSQQKVENSEIWFGIALGEQPSGPPNRSGFMMFLPPKPWTTGHYLTDANGKIAVISVSDDALVPAPTDSDLPATRVKSENEIKNERQTILRQLLSRLGTPDDGSPTIDGSPPIWMEWNYRHNLDKSEGNDSHVRFSDGASGFSVGVIARHPQWVAFPPIPLAKQPT